MQLSVFNTGVNKTGFRLQYMEVYNWGTFDEHIHSIKPQGETSLLTGSNGSGKTTFIDALLTLIVPEKKYRFYNQSSGSDKKGDRNEDSYVMGGYSFANGEIAGTTKTIYLRENKDQTYSILLANFANDADQFVTLFQVRYYVSGEMKKQYGLAHKPLHIEADFRPFDLSGNWKRRLEQAYNKGAQKQIKWFDTANKYAQELVDSLGMQSVQALHLFNQVVGIKVLGNLDEFVRTHMLESRNMEEQFQELKRHLSTLLDAQRNIEKIEEQISLLKNLEAHYQKYNNIVSSIAKYKDDRETGKVWNSYIKNQLVTDELEKLKIRDHGLTESINSNKGLMIKLAEEERQLKNQIDNNEQGKRLQQLETEKVKLNEQCSDAQENLAAFKQWCETLHIKDEPADISTYNRILKEVHRQSLKLGTEQRNNMEDEYAAKRTIEEATTEKASIENEINILQISKSNIRGNLINLRKEICENLKLDIDDLPFAGELIQVKSEEIHWQPALEKLLRPFALRLLVPDKHYKRVINYVNNNDLKAKLVCHHVVDYGVKLNPDVNTIYEKLEFNAENKLCKNVEHEIMAYYNYTCVEDMKSFQRYDRAVTEKGLIKSKYRHEKDDRPNRNNPEDYVLGWNNEKKKSALIDKRNKLGDMITEASVIVKKCTTRSARLQDQLYAVKRIEEHGGFSGINVNEFLQRIHKLELQISALRKSNKELDILKAQLIDVESQKIDLERISDDLTRQKINLEQSLDRMKNLQVELNELLQHITYEDKDKILQFQIANQQYFSDVNLDNIDKRFSDFKDHVDDLISKAEIERNNEQKHLIRSITKLKSPSPDLLTRFPDWIADVNQFSDEPEHAVEYVEWMNRLTTDNLPKYKRDFENYINVTITYKIGGLNEELEKWERDISNSIQKLNQSLEKINFNRLPDTYIQLEKRPVPAGTEIKEFRGRLLDALPQAANWQQSSFEEKALHFSQKIKPLIDGLDENEKYRSRVLDVRNWFEFWANELYKNTRESKKVYRQMGQLSGGEKAQLTYTILCSAIAYQFGITRDSKHNRSLRFIAVDESFSNQDEEKATYLMELCKQLNLQLLVVTPSDKIQIVQDFIAHVHLVQRVNGRNSVLYNMTIKELQEKIKAAENDRKDIPLTA